MFGSQKSFLSSSVDNHEQAEGQEYQNSFLREGEKRIDKSNAKIEKSVEEFAKNLGPYLTNQLTEKFEEYKKDPNCSGLTDSDIWLQALQKLYGNNQDKMPGTLEGYLKNMIKLLGEYKEAHNTADGFATILRSSSSTIDLSEKSSKLSREELPPFNSRIRPAEGVVPFNG